MSGAGGDLDICLYIEESQGEGGVVVYIYMRCTCSFRAGGVSACTFHVSPRGLTGITQLHPIKPALQRQRPCFSVAEAGAADPTGRGLQKKRGSDQSCRASAWRTDARSRYEKTAASEAPTSSTDSAGSDSPSDTLACYENIRGWAESATDAALGGTTLPSASLLCSRSSLQGGGGGGGGGGRVPERVDRQMTLQEDMTRRPVWSQGFKRVASHAFARWPTREGLRRCRI